MTILRANLKHFYQCRGLWFFYLLLLCQTPLIALPFFNNDRSNRFFGYLIISYIAGLFVFGLQQDTITKPFSFCMPGHRKVSRKVIILVGGILNIILSMVFLAYPGLTFPYSLLVAIAGGCVGMAVYLLSVRIMAKGSQTNIWLGLAPLYIFGVILLDIDKMMQETMASNPFVFMAASLMICWLVWQWLGQDSLARKFCGKIVPGMFDGFNTRKMQKIRNAKMEELGKKNTALTNWSENFFLTKMHMHKFLSRDRYIWGRLYARLGVFPLYLRPWSPVAIIAVLLYFGYFNIQKMSIGPMLFLLPAIVALNMKLPAYPSLVLPGGRREIFTGVLASALSVTIITGVVLIILTIISHLIEPFLPPIHIKTLPLSYRAMDIDKFYLFLTIMPITFSIALFIKQQPWLKMIAAILLMQIAIFGSIFSNRLEIIMTPVIIASVVIASWLTFVMVAHHFCMKRCLVSQTKG